MLELFKVHWEATLGVLTYIKRAPRKGLISKWHDHLFHEAYFESRYNGGKEIGN